MVDVQLLSAFSAVVSVFHAAIENVKTLRHHSPRGVKNERTIMEKWLQETLETAEVQISQRFSQYSTELGESFAAGDDIALTKLSRIAILMQSGLVRTLQMAVESDKHDLDLSYLQEDALFKKKDTLDALDALRDRLLHPSALSSPTSPRSNPPFRRPSVDSVATHSSYQTISSQNSVSGRSLPHDERDVRPNTTWSQPVRRSSSRTSAPKDMSRVTDVANPDWPPSSAMNLPIRPAEPRPQLTVDPNLDRSKKPDRFAFPPIPTDWDKEVVVSVQPDPVLSPASRTNSWAQTSTSAFPPNQTPMGSAPAPLSPSSSVRSPPRLSPSSSVSSRQPSNTPPQPPSTGWPTPVIPEGGEASHHRYKPFSFIKRPHRTNSMPASATTDMRGRPSKENNYWGFCKSAWDIRVDPKKGLEKQHRQDGFHMYKTVWLCRGCSFLGDAFGSEKMPTVDPNVHTAANGIRYRWIFLAKSHAKKKPMEGASFGCVFCVSEGKATGIFGNVEVLMNHIIVDHGKGIRQDIMENNKCILGRVASSSEDFDINIPPTTGS